MQNLKLLTLNLHCLVEENLTKKQQIIASKIAELDIDIIFLQEVAQTQTNPIVLGDIRNDNYGYTLQTLLAKEQKTYYLYYEKIKQSFGIYDEGVAILSKYELTFHQAKRISRTIDYNNWKARKILSCMLPLEHTQIYLATTHFGWSDGFEVFEDQVDLAYDVINHETLSIIAGDFNVQPDTKEYQHILSTGLIDVFAQDPEYFDKPTHISNIDVHTESRRIDYIMTNKPVRLIEREILFTTELVSDHYGVYAKIEFE